MKDLANIVTSAVKHSQKIQKLKIVIDNTEAMDVLNILKDELEIIQEKVLFLIKENGEHKNEIRQLKKLLTGKHGFDVKDNVYYLPDGDGPFCPYCYENRKRKIRLRRVVSEEDSVVRHACRMCDSKFSSV